LLSSCIFLKERERGGKSRGKEVEMREGEGKRKRATEEMTGWVHLREKEIEIEKLLGRNRTKRGGYY